METEYIHTINYEMFEQEVSIKQSDQVENKCTPLHY